MDISVISGLMIPFIGTTLGSAAVFFMRSELSGRVGRGLTGFAAGVMTAASVWSLLIPAIEQSRELGAMAFLPPFVGFWTGAGFLMLIDRVIERLRSGGSSGAEQSANRTAMMALAVTLHNIPEGMAVGVAYAGLVSGSAEISASGAFALSLGIAIQNFPEGAIISMPLRAQGSSRLRAFAGGSLSGAVEPVFGALTLLFAGLAVPAMPYLLSFAAGAMIYVVVEELIPEISVDTGSRLGALTFTLGFTVMMALDVALG